jgi:hypothetical protein
LNHIVHYSRSGLESPEYGILRGKNTLFSYLVTTKWEHMRGRRINNAEGVPYPTRV